MAMRSGGSGSGGEKGALKKGPWTKTEDEILMEYVRRHGEGNWNAVQKNSGLSRCGKSCRLRWANHLRPNLKKGSFSPEEEMLILRLHAQLGNKWARMAAHQLPGRTDNEIKNYWNTRIKKRLKAGLPLYPPDIQPMDSPAATPPSTPSTDSVPRYAIPGLIQFPSPPHLPATPLFSHHPFLSPPPTPKQAPSPVLHLNRYGDAGLAYQLPPLPCQLISPTAPDAAAALFRYGLCSNNYELGSPVGHPLPDPMSPAPFSVKMELPSCQPFPEPLCTGGGVGVQSGGNSGLLDALLQDSQGVTMLPVDAAPPPKLPASVNHINNNPEMILWSSPAAAAAPLVLNSVCKWEDPNDSSVAIRPKEEPVCMVDPSREDVLTLLDKIPTIPMSSLNSPTPEWYSGNSGEASNGQLLEDVTANDGIGSEIVQMVKSEEHDWASGLCPWSNMPGIC